MRLAIALWQQLSGGNQNRYVMQIVTVEIENEDGFHLLQGLEKLNILKIITGNIAENKTKLSDKYRGVFTKEDADSFNHHTQTMRKEWDNT